MNYRHWLG